MPESSQFARDIAQRVARESYGKLVAFLAKRTRDVAAAEDALSEAFAAALRDWPITSVPKNPQAWLMTVAKRKIIDAARSAQVSAASQEHQILLQEELSTLELSDFPDERLGLMFACAHPSIDPNIRSPLILQTVLGLNAMEIGSAFLVTPEAMGQRLARAKHKIKIAGIPFRIPDISELSGRLEVVLEAVYAAYANGWSDPINSQNNLAEEAIWLGRVVTELLPNEPEALGLLALMLFLQSRKNARRNDAGNFVPLNKQDPKLWTIHMFNEAELLLHKAGGMKVMGRYQLEAAIQSVHTSRRFSGITDWAAILDFYDALHKITQSSVVAINRAVALSEVKDPQAGLDALPNLDKNPQLANFQPYHAARAALLSRANKHQEAMTAYGLAIGLEGDAAIRAFLIEQQSTVLETYRSKTRLPLSPTAI